jgi:hypothetical protein
MRKRRPRHASDVAAVKRRRVEVPHEEAVHISAQPRPLPRATCLRGRIGSAASAKDSEKASARVEHDLIGVAEDRWLKDEIDAL